MNISKLQELKADTKEMALEGSASGCASQLREDIQWLIENEKDQDKKDLLKWMFPLACLLVGYTHQ